MLSPVITIDTNIDSFTKVYCLFLFVSVCASVGVCYCVKLVNKYICVVQSIISTSIISKVNLIILSMTFIEYL